MVMFLWCFFCGGVFVAFLWRCSCGVFFGGGVFVVV